MMMMMIMIIMMMMMMIIIINVLIKVTLITLSCRNITKHKNADSSCWTSH